MAAIRETQNVRQGMRYSLALAAIIAMIIACAAIIMAS